MSRAFGDNETLKCRTKIQQVASAHVCLVIYVVSFLILLKYLMFVCAYPHNHDYTYNIVM